MPAGFRSPPSTLILALVVSATLHMAVLLNLGPQARRPTKMPAPISAKLVQIAPESAKVAQQPPARVSGPRGRTKQKSRTTEPPPSIPVPVPAVEPEVVSDVRIREVIVVSPGIYGLAANYRSAAIDLPYAWSSDIDGPPQAQSVGPINYPPDATSDGLVLVRAVLGANGRIDDFDILCGSAPFVEVTKSAVTDSAFRPATSRGVPSRTWLLLEFAFIEGNADENFDPSLADAALTSMRAACAQQLAAQPR